MSERLAAKPLRVGRCEQRPAVSGGSAAWLGLGPGSLQAIAAPRPRKVKREGPSPAAERRWGKKCRFLPAAACQSVAPRLPPRLPLACLPTPQEAGRPAGSRLAGSARARRRCGCCQIPSDSDGPAGGAAGRAGGLLPRRAGHVVHRGVREGRPLLRQEVRFASAAPRAGGPGHRALRAFAESSATFGPGCRCQPEIARLPAPPPPPTCRLAADEGGEPPRLVLPVAHVRSPQGSGMRADWAGRPVLASCCGTSAGRSRPTRIPPLGGKILPFPLSGRDWV